MFSSSIEKLIYHSGCFHQPRKNEGKGALLRSGRILAKKKMLYPLRAHGQQIQAHYMAH